MECVETSQKSSPVSNFMKINLAIFKLFHDDTQTDMTKLMDLFLQLLIVNVARKVDLHKQSVCVIKHRYHYSLRLLFETFFCVLNMYQNSRDHSVWFYAVHSVFQQWIERTSTINENQCQWHHTFLFLFYTQEGNNLCMKGSILNDSPNPKQGQTGCCPRTEGSCGSSGTRVLVPL